MRGGGEQPSNIINENLFVNPYWMTKRLIVNQQNKNVYNGGVDGSLTIDMWYTEYNIAVYIDDEEDCLLVSRNNPNGWVNTGFWQFIPDEKIIKDQWYTVSFIAKGSGHIDAYSSNTFTEYQNHRFKELTDKYKLYYYNFKNPSTTGKFFNHIPVSIGFLSYRTETDPKIYLKAAKLEKGLESTLAYYKGEGYGFDGWVINDNIPAVDKTLYDCQRYLQPVMIFGKNSFYNDYYPTIITNKKSLIVKVDLNPPMLGSPKILNPGALAYVTNQNATWKTDLQILNTEFFFGNKYMISNIKIPDTVDPTLAELYAGSNGTFEPLWIFSDIYNYK